ncbi:hypothetical protein [Gracilibacillus timonensis]|uniref:hypothetical protein n=1 Tax=Gracilibacillus timonensis TaxID=1816696 RepID=UPI000825DD5B|nr:hypothetical protein [Gracilibacillus timonensis]
MKNDQEKIVMLPQWRHTLEQRATEAMQDSHFQEAYEHFHQLTENGVYSHEVMTGKLICMMELNMAEEAEELCEQLIAKQDQYYSSYVHIYATLLFQSSKYEEVMSVIDEVLEGNSPHQEVPALIKEQLRHVYQLSEELQHQDDEQTFNEVTAQLEQALQENNDRQQWYMIKRLTKMDIYQDSPLYREMLIQPTTHPVVKTAMLEYYQKMGTEAPIHIEKFNLQDDIRLHPTESIIPASFFSGIMYFLEELQQEDPTKYQMIQFILERFAYVYTPFLPPKDDYKLLAESLFYYVSRSFQLYDDTDHQTSEMKQHYVDMITMSDKLYASILDI